MKNVPFHAARLLKAVSHRLPKARAHPRDGQNLVSENCWRFAFRRYGN